MTHKQWVDNEYSLWVKALQESTVHNFKEHPMVQRMLSLNLDCMKFKGEALSGKDWPTLTQINLIEKINDIGFNEEGVIGDDCWRMIYYALEILKRNPSSICEIGGGVGQFYAILRALGWKGSYEIIDLPEVQGFQELYLKEVSKQTGLNLKLEILPHEMVVSFYALGEFDDASKEQFIRLVCTGSPHGYIAWNPHSGASDDLSLFKHDIKVTDGIEPNIKIITW